MQKKMPKCIISRSFLRCFLRLALVLLVPLPCIGCGSDGTYPVSGSVELQNGEPLRGGALVFRSDGNASYPTTVNANGEFVVRASPEVTGLPPGNYKVIVQEPPSDNIDMPEPPKIHFKYTAGSTTDLEANVAEQSNVFHFPLDPPDRRLNNKRR